MFADLERCGEDEKTTDFDSDLTMEPDDGGDEDQGGSKDMKEKRRSREAIYPDYEGWGAITTFTDFGNTKHIRLGRCVRAPSVQNLLSCSALARWGHECILNKSNPRMVCKDGTVVPIYFFNNLFVCLM